MKLSLKNILVAQGEDFKITIPQWECTAGQHLLIKGKSGAGKTTFLHLLSGLLTPQSGEVHVGSQILGQLPESERSNLRRRSFGLIFQRLNLMDRLTVYENIALGYYPHRPQFEKIQKTLEQLKLEKKIETAASVLSLGEQQRVAVARALINQPEIILADEPTSSLDDANAESVMDYLMAASRGKTLLVVSHDHRVEKYFKSSIEMARIGQS